MTLYELLQRDRYSELRELMQARLPDMFEYTKQVYVLEWHEDFAIADKNPEAIEERLFMEELLKNGLISKEDYMRWERQRDITYASITMGVAFTDSNEVSFRDFPKRLPTAPVVFHELGHCYFKEPDPLWCDSYIGGETIARLILTGFLEGNEKHIRYYMDFLKFIYQDPYKAQDLLDQTARKTAKRLNLPVKNFLELRRLAGYLPTLSPAKMELFFSGKHISLSPEELQLAFRGFFLPAGDSFDLLLQVFWEELTQAVP
ncbi:MAG: hypothetical protein ACK42C_00055 [Aquificaceae bacterium]